jgi:hypothetical protein
MKKLKFVAIALLIAGTAVADHHEETLAGAVLDDFHDAAAHGDKDRYLGHMTDDAVFMGYVNSRFKDGAGWNYQSVERKMVIADNADTAWFDEVVFSESNGRFRGTGVLVKQGGQWKIAHYAMSFLVFNENWQEVIELTKKTRAEKENP